MARTIKTNDGTSLAYEQHGETGPILVLIHGWSGSRRYFSSVFEHLAGRCRVYALDLRHHGDSGRPSHGLHVARLAADLNDFLTELRLTDVCLLGASMGAAVIWSYIENYRTSRLSGAVFVDQAPLQNRAEGWDLGSKGCYDAASLAEASWPTSGPPPRGPPTRACPSPSTRSSARR
uniref:Non-heme chloroperoxidase n=1 Tax=Tetraselmis sp. GSL018 TaxID=582737 RepID=A0A061R9M7_9CHLO